MITPIEGRPFDFGDAMMLAVCLATVVWAAREFLSMLRDTETPPRPRTGRRTSERAGTP
jgi:hypothetical protein